MRHLSCYNRVAKSIEFRDGSGFKFQLYLLLCVALNQLLHLFEPQFYLLRTGENTISLQGYSKD